MKSPAIKELENLAVNVAKKKYPSLPLSHFIATRKYSDNSANALTKSVIDFIKLSGHFAERINTTGTLRDNRQIVTNCIGQTRQIGRAVWTKSGSTNGSADIHSLINGKAVYIEIKYGNDFQSEAQKLFEQNVTKAGGIYLIVRDFQSFYDWYQKESPIAVGL
jgi:hypothetical protein